MVNAYVRFLRVLMYYEMIDRFGLMTRRKHSSSIIYYTTTEALKLINWITWYPVSELKNDTSVTFLP